MLDSASLVALFEQEHGEASSNQCVLIAFFDCFFTTAQNHKPVSARRRVLLILRVLLGLNVFRCSSSVFRTSASTLAHSSFPIQPTKTFPLRNIWSASRQLTDSLIAFAQSSHVRRYVASFFTFRTPTRVATRPEALQKRYQILIVIKSRPF